MQPHPLLSGNIWLVSDIAPKLLLPFHLWLEVWKTGRSRFSRNLSPVSTKLELEHFQFIRIISYYFFAVIWGKINISTFLGFVFRACATWSTMVSIATYPWGIPKPRKEVLETLLVLHARPSILTLSIEKHPSIMSIINVNTLAKTQT